MEPHFTVKTLSASVHGRYLAESPGGPGPHPLLVGFHGYGENAESHLAQLRSIPGSSRWVRCAVQALHPFYNQKSNRVVASWMTRQDRELAIADNIRYVAGVVEQVRRDESATGPLVYAGFSQGVAMAWRAAAGAGHRCSGLIMLAGDVPPEIRVNPPAEIPPLLLARGAGDSWYTQQKMDEDLAFLRSRGASVETLVFEGGHEWSAEFLQAASLFLGELGTQYQFSTSPQSQ